MTSRVAGYLFCTLIYTARYAPFSQRNVCEVPSLWLPFSVRYEPFPTNGVPMEIIGSREIQHRTSLLDQVE